MIELEKQTIRAELLDIVSRCQAMLLRLQQGGAVAPVLIPQLATPQGLSITNTVRQWIKQRGVALGEFTVTTIIGTIRAEHPGRVIPNATVSAALRNLTLEGTIEVVKRSGKGREPNVYRVGREDGVRDVLKVLDQSD